MANRVAMGPSLDLNSLTIFRYFSENHRGIGLCKEKKSMMIMKRLSDWYYY